MRAIGFWSECPPDPRAEVAAGRMPNFLDAPSFETWLQCVFLPRARAAVQAGELPERSRIGVLAMRQYDYHSVVPAAAELLRLLHGFDAIVEGRA